MPIRAPLSIIRQAWSAYDPHTAILEVADISAKVSTNHVYKVSLAGDRFVIAKLSYFGRYEHFREEHVCINQLARRLPPPYEGLLARSLIREGEVFTFRSQAKGQDVWAVFYQPVQIKEKLPRQLEPPHIIKLAEEMARFHQACTDLAPDLPPSSKSLRSDIEELLQYLNSETGRAEFGGHIPLIRRHGEAFLQQLDHLGFDNLPRIPVFVDWNIGNFSITKSGRLFSRWDYDWFRMSSRIMDFYFCSRVVSAVGDRTIFSYLLDPLLEKRFGLFLQAYHAVFPLSEAEIRFIPEAYRFFILNYTVKYGAYFFHQVYAEKLQEEAFHMYLPQLEARAPLVPWLDLLNQ